MDTYFFTSNLTIVLQGLHVNIYVEIQAAALRLTARRFRETLSVI